MEWQAFLAAFANVINANPRLVTLVTVFGIMGFFMLIAQVKPDENGKIEKKVYIWLRWSLFVSAFIISPMFFYVSIIAGAIGLFVENDKNKNWKYAAAIVGVLYALGVQ